MENQSNKIGIFGGTFDPIHLGHIQCAEIACNELQLSKVIFVPAGLPNFKADNDIASKEHRLNMVKIAIDKHKNFEVNNTELTRQGISYTSDTINIIKDQYPNSNLYFITGSDAALSFNHWHNYQEILEKATLVAVMRKGSFLSEENKQNILNDCNGKVEFIQADALDISSHELREMIRINKDTTKWMNESVVQYIHQNNVYPIQ